jgi:hypothetical protein
LRLLFIARSDIQHFAPFSPIKNIVGYGPSVSCQFQPSRCGVHRRVLRCLIWGRRRYMANVWQQFARIVTEMPNPYLARLRLARVRCNENIVRLESSLALQRSRREAIEAAIHDLEPELRLPPPKLKPNPIFVHNEITRLALGVLRDAGEPLGVAEIAIRVLTVKGLPLPPPRIKRMTRARLRAVFSRCSLSAAWCGL